MTRLEKFPLGKTILYSSGQLGFAISDRIWVTFMLYFYLPPAETGMPELISNVTFWGILTVTGLVTIFGRVVDAFADPLVGFWSDKSKSKLGRRKVFMLFGGLPLMVSAVLLFFPPFKTAGIGNALYMALMLGLLLFFFTVYVLPYLALIPELTHTNEDRMNMVTIQAVFSLAGAIVVMIFGYMLWGAIEGWGIEKAMALKLTIIVLALIGLVFLYLAILPIDEKRYCDAAPAEAGLIESLKTIFANKAFMYYLFGTICFWFSLNIISQTAPYYVTVLLKKEEAFASILFAAVFGVALIFFPIINAASRYIEKRVIMIIGLAIFVFVGRPSIFWARICFSSRHPISRLSFSALQAYQCPPFL